MTGDDRMAQRLALCALPLDPSSLANLDDDLSREWLVTNGLGGYAFGTVAGATTRSYHGLLVAAVQPPTDRRVLVTKVDEVVTLADGEAIALGVNEWAGGAIAPEGYRRLVGFTLDAGIPCWTYQLPDGSTLVKHVWMEYGQNLTYARYRYVGAGAPDGNVTLTLTPFCLDREHHSVTRGSESWRFDVRPSTSACAIQATPDALTYQLIASEAATFVECSEWYWNVYHRAERERGLPDTEDVFVPGHFAVTLSAGQQATLALWAGADLPQAMSALGGASHEATVEAAYQRELTRRDALLQRAGDRVWNVPSFTQLTLAADQFIVSRADPVTNQPGSTVIAGYPWFTDWGRDTMIALPGLTLATGRHEDAATLLRTFARYVSQGMIPNRFPDAATQFGALASPPEYNTVDATLWYFQALRRYLTATDDHALLSELFPVLTDIIAWHVRGTRYGIIVDPRDGLLTSGAEGVQLTWMDARVDGWVVTPRRGKPVEISALWCGALASMEEWALALGRDAALYGRLRQQARQSFFARYWYAAGGYLYDVVDVDGVDGANDWALRPNQLIALAVALDLVPESAAVSIMETVARELLTPMGLRTLTPADPRFIGGYEGDQRSRDAAYHQGTAWPWLAGAFVDVSRATGACVEQAAALVASLRGQLVTAGIGTIGEIANGAPPYRPCGCVAQAWSVAETLRILWEFKQE